MPIKRSVDSKGVYYRWGESGKKYYYKPGNKRSRNIAYNKARKQEIAIYASGYKKK